MENLKNEKIEMFKSSVNSDLLIIEGSLISVINKFGDKYSGRIVNGKMVSKTSIGLSYLVRVYDEYRDYQNK